MTAFVKPLLVTVAGAACLAASGGAQTPAPAAPPPPVAAPAVAEFDEVAVYGGDVVIGRPAPAQGGRTVWTFGGEDGRVRELARKLAATADDDDRAKLRGELKAAIAKAFDARLKGQEQQVVELEKQLKRLKAEVAKRAEAKAEIVADRLAALEKQAKGLGW